jgi:lysophospholipase L1-like esterase
VPRLPEADGARAGRAATDAAPRLLVVGDSSAAGVGVATQDRALIGQLLRALDARGHAAWHWRLLARSGVTSEQALALIDDDAVVDGADVAIIVTGVNDVVDQVPSLHAVRARERLVNLLRNRVGVQHVVVCPLPPIHQFPALPQPLRWMAGADAQRHNRALRHWVRARAATVGDVSSVRLDHVQLTRESMASDGFHPGEPVYREVALALADHIVDAVVPRLQRAPRTDA